MSENSAGKSVAGGLEGVDIVVPSHDESFYEQILTPGYAFEFSEEDGML